MRWRAGSSSTRLRRRAFAVAGTALTALLLHLAAISASATTYPSGFTETDLASGGGLTGPTAVDWAPDGRMFIAEKRGTVRVVGADGTLLPTPLIDIRNQVNNKSDRGLLGLAVDADFETNRWLYLLYTYETNPAVPDSDGPMTARLTRVTVNPNSTVANPSNPETSILGADYEDPCPAPDNTRDCIPSDYIWHTIGTVRSDPTDGTLWVGVGDGHGIDDAWVGDPYAPGESPYIFRPYDEHSYSGKILHVDRNGRGLPGHPFCPSDTNLSHTCTKIYAEGFRNPFRFTLRPAGAGGTTPGLVAGDVGQSRWEEVDLVQPGKSYGWPCWEANDTRDPYEDLPTCQAEYAKEGTPNAPIPPAWEYPHAAGSNAVVAGPVYQGPNYPPSFDGKVFVGDYAQGWIKLLTLNGNQVTNVENFATGWSPGVDLELMPNGDLAYVDIGFGATPAGVRRVAYTGPGQPPEPVAEADPTIGDPPLTVQFTGSNSTDRENAPLTYDWDFGDGSPHSSEADPTHTYTEPGLYTVRLTVDDGSGTNPSTTLEIQVGQNDGPTANIVAPEDGDKYEDGSPVDLEGTGTDPEDGDLTGGSLEWEIRLVHIDHVHPLDSLTGQDASFTPLTDHDADSHYEVILKVTDSFGASDTDRVQVDPKTVAVTFASEPAGAPIRYSEEDLRNAPFDQNAAVGYNAGVEAEPTFARDGHTYAFSRWSDDGARQHQITIPGVATTLTARYERQTPPSTTINSGPSGPTTNVSPSFTFSSGDADSVFECKVDTGSFDDCTSPHQVGPLPDGPHQFSVRALDPNVGTPDATPAIRNFEVDTAAPAAPTITATDPDSPADNSSPEVRGTTGGGSPTQVKVYKNANCSGAPAATGTVATFTGVGITVSVTPDSTTDLSARATDAAGNDSACSSSIAYTEDSTNPTAPSITDTDPDSPANDNQPRVKGNAEAGSTVRLYATASCSGTPLATGTAAAFGSGGIAVPVAGDATTSLRATATDEADNPSPCSAPFAYTEDSTGPAAPAITDTDPDSPSSDAEPEVKGTVGAGSPTGVRVYTSSSCSGTPAASGSVAQFTGAGLTVAVPNDQTTNLTAVTIDAAGNPSPCSPVRAYTEDSTAPAPPAITGTAPPSPSPENEPEVRGNAEGGSTVRLYESGDCSGAVEAQGSAASFASPGLTASVTADQTHRFTATATDAAGNTSSCSTAFDYTEDSTAPAPPEITDTDPDSPSNHNDPAVKGTAEAGSTLTLYESGSCAGPVEAQGSAASFASPGLGASVVADGTRQFTATATDAAGNTSSCSAAFAYTEDSTPPPAPTITGTAPSSPSPDNSPEVRGTAPAGSTVRLYESSGCSGPVEAQGTAADFASPGLTAAVAADGTRQFTATATDAAGNTSACSSSFAYTEDSTAPPAPTVTDTDPNSPASDNAPRVKGSAQAGATVRLYESGDCSGAVEAQGGAASFASPGLSASVASDHPHQFTATATDAAGNASPCSAALAYTEDSTPPAAPSIADTDPDSPSNENEPEVKGTAEAGSTVRIYSTSDCSGTPLATGDAAAFNGTAGITVPVPGDATTQLRAAATDAAANTSSCSAAFAYSEDSTLPPAPAITGTDPSSPSPDNTPEVRGTAQAGSTVRLYESSDCSGPVEAQGTAASFASPGLPASVPADATHRFTATATDAAGNISPCSASFAYAEDSTAPAAPSITDTDPDSPAPDNEPKVKGSAEAGSTVRVYQSGDCSGPVEVQGTAADFASPGLSASVASDAAHQFTATATDPAGNTSPCSAPRAYTEDSIAPDAPAITGTDPPSPANDDEPEVRGTVGAGSPTQVKLFENSSCAGAPDTVGPVAAFTGDGITVNVPADATTDLSARTTDAAGNDSACSNAIAYTEDSELPATPEITGTDPASPSSDTDPKVKGDAEPGSTVRLYESSDCSGPVEAQGTAGDFSAPGLSASVAADQAHQFTATATDAVGNTSACSAAFSYTEDSTAPATPAITDTDPDSPANDNEPEVNGDAEAGSTVRLYESSDCSGPVEDQGTAAEFASAGLTATVADDQAHQFSVEAVDGAENVSDCSATFDYTEDSGIPEAPAITDTDPDPPANDTSPEVKGTVGAGEPVQVKLYGNGDCAGAPGASGTVATFTGAGITLIVDADETTLVSARATDAAGNDSACSASIAYTEDSSAPGAPRITDTDPDSPANDNDPDVKGSAESGSRVRLYESSDCSGAIEAEGSASSFRSPGFDASVSGDRTHRFTATATDAAGNVSPCAVAFAYTEDSTAPVPPSITATDPDSPANDNDPRVMGTAEGGSTVRIYSSADCTGSPIGTGSAADFGGGSGITVSVPGDQATALRAVATDPAGNASSCSDPLAYTEDSGALEPGLEAPSSQRAGRPIKLELLPLEDGDVSAGGEVIVTSRGSGPRAAADRQAVRSRKRIRLGIAQAALVAGERTILKLRPKGKAKRSRGALREVERMVRRDAKATAKLDVNVTDAAGNETRFRPVIKLRARGGGR